MHEPTSPPPFHLLITDEFLEHTIREIEFATPEHMDTFTRDQWMRRMLRDAILRRLESK